MAKILVTEDRELDRKFLVSLLRANGHTLLEAEDGVRGLEIAKAECPDLVISDLLMPSMDGFELVRRIRSEPKIARTQVIFYTATFLEAEACHLAEDCGVKNILIKPADPDAILRVVNEALTCPDSATQKVLAERFHEDHMRLLTTKLASRVEMVVPRLMAFVELGQRMSAASDPESLLKELATGVRDILGSKYAAVLAFDKESEEPNYYFISGIDESQLPSLKVPTVRAGVLLELLAGRKPFVSSGLGNDPLTKSFPFEKLTSFIGIPLGSGKTTVGVLYLTNKLGGSRFSEEDAALLTMLGTQASVAYEKAILTYTLRESEEHFRSLFDIATDLIFVLSPGGFIKEYNPACERGLGWSASEWRSRHFSGIIHPDDVDAASKNFQELMEGESPPMMRNRILCKSGEYRIVDAKIAARIQEGRILEIVGIGRDVTEQLQMERQLRQAQKMEAVGQLAGGVAHDFNNILSVILGYGDRVLGKIREDDPLHKPVESMMKAAQRAVGLTRQLLTFSRQEIATPKVLDLNNVVREVNEMLLRLIGEDIELNFVPCPVSGRVEADPGQIEQIALNLAVNARDAMPVGGKLTIEVRNVDVDPDCARLNPGAKPGRYVALEVTDTGCGMDEEIRAHIFEPFFTTKEPGKGTGLGLATVYGIVKQSGGFISVRSEQGKGTTFKIHFPEVDSRTDPIRDEKLPATLTSGTETILLVEDNEGVRTLVKEILQENGYTVMEAKHGADALIKGKQHSETIHLLITDVIMPEISGAALAEQLVPFHPEMRVVYTSGYTDDAVLRNGIRNSTVPFLQKPFSAETLTHLVRSVLDSKPSVGKLRKAA